MKHIYVIPGTGVPKDMAKDFNYQLYLRTVFNFIIDECVHHNITKPVIVFTGGHTDCWPPYHRSEAGEMAKAFRALMHRPATAKYTRHWIIRLDEHPLSALENIMAVKKLVQPESRVTWLSETTRTRKYAKLFRRLISKSVRMVPIDYDVSANRYRYETASNKEKLGYAFDQWALKSPANLRQHRRYHQDRLDWLRKFSPARHVQAIKQWNDIATSKLPAEFQHEAKRRGLI